jgi:hypothetical protein
VSFSALNWAYEQHCPNSTAKAILAYLANRANQTNGECWPSIATIVRETQFTKISVRKAIRALVNCNLVTVLDRSDLKRGQLSNVYRLAIASPPVISDTFPPEEALPVGSDSPTPPVQDMTPPPGADLIPKPSDKPPLEPEDCSLRSQRARVTGSRIGSDDDPDFAAFWDRYPRKDDKGHARKAWIKARRTTPAAAILTGLSAYPFSESPRYQPLPATWLNGERWLAAAEADMFDPVLRAAGLTPADFANATPADQQWMRMLQ